MNNFFIKLRRVSWRDLLDAWKLLPAILLAPMYRLLKGDFWIICEDANEARDNGYWFFKYVCEYHPEQKCIYAIRRESPDYDKVVTFGETVEYGSLKHWIVYLASSKKISSQKAGNPNAAIFYVLEVYGFLKDNRIFLQHGVIINNLEWLYYKVTKIKRFICGTYPEYEFIKNTFGYPDENIVYTGLCRFDNLHDSEVDKHAILIMPTWREWIADEDARLLKIEGTTNITDTNYFKKWRGFLSDVRLERLATKYGVKFYFYPHRNMQKYIDSFPSSNEYLSVFFAKDIDIQDLLKKSVLMITDYSSVFFDMLYMKKPVICYQFDYDTFRKNQYSEGYFDYKNNPFLKSYGDENSVFKELERYIQCNFMVSSDYEKAHKEFFKLYDRKNCERIYEVTKRL